MPVLPPNQQRQSTEGKGLHDQMKPYAVSCGPLSGTHLLTLVEPAKDTDVRPSVVEPVVSGAASAVVGQRY